MSMSLRDIFSAVDCGQKIYVNVIKNAPISRRTLLEIVGTLVALGAIGYLGHEVMRFGTLEKQVRQCSVFRDKSIQQLNLPYADEKDFDGTAREVQRAIGGLQHEVQQCSDFKNGVYEQLGIPEWGANNFTRSAYDVKRALADMTGMGSEYAKIIDRGFHSLNAESMKMWVNAPLALRDSISLNQIVLELDAKNPVSAVAQLSGLSRAAFDCYTMGARLDGEIKDWKEREKACQQTSNDRHAEAMTAVQKSDSMKEGVYKCEADCTAKVQACKDDWTAKVQACKDARKVAETNLDACQKTYSDTVAAHNMAINDLRAKLQNVETSLSKYQSQGLLRRLLSWIW